MQVAQTIKHPYFKAHSLAEIARSYAAAGKNSQAAEIFSLAETVAQTIQHSNSKDIALTDIARSYAIAGQYEQALRVASSIKSDAKRESVLKAIARYSVESINRAQPTYYSEHSTFANSFTELGLDIPAKTGNYEYSVSTSATSAFTYATPLKKSSSAYIGGVFAVPNATGTQTETTAILCVSDSSSLQQLDRPTLQNGALACPPRTSQISPNSP